MSHRDSPLPCGGRLLGTNAAWHGIHGGSSPHVHCCMALRAPPNACHSTSYVPGAPSPVMTGGGLRRSATLTPAWPRLHLCLGCIKHAAAPQLLQTTPTCPPALPGATRPASISPCSCLASAYTAWTAMVSLVAHLPGKPSIAVGAACLAGKCSQTPHLACTFARCPRWRRVCEGPTGPPPHPGGRPGWPHRQLHPRLALLRLGQQCAPG